MEIHFNVTGAARKAFVTVVGNLVGWEPIYTKAPTFAYVVNNLTIDKDGTLLFPEGMTMDEALQLLEALAERGYPSADLLPTAVSLGEDITEEATPPEEVPAEAVVDMDVQEEAPVTAFPEQVPEAPDRLSIELPLEGFTELALSNLEKLVASKAGLLRQSIGAASLPILRDGERICFPWFAPDSTPEETKVYPQLVSALCEMAKTQQRITATSREVENPKYAMRCFLLRLGFIGDEYAAARKFLLRNLSGNSSFKSGARKERPADNAQNPADSAPAMEGVNSAGGVPEPPETALTSADSDLAEMLADAVLIHEVNASFEVSAHE